MGYETECSDEQLADLNEVRRLAGLKPITETAEQTHERRTRNLAKRRGKFDRELKAYICRRHASQAVAASRGSTSAGSTAAREEAGKELRSMTARAAGMEQKPQAVAAARGMVSAPSERDRLIALTREAAGMTPAPVVPAVVPPTPAGVAERQNAAEKAQAVATGVVDTVDPRGPAGKAIADAIREQHSGLSAEQDASLQTLRGILFEAIKTCLQTAPALSKAGAIKALVGYFNQWAKDEQAEDRIDPDKEAAAVWDRAAEVAAEQKRFMGAGAVQPVTNPTVPGLGLSRSRDFVLKDVNGQAITKPLAL